MNDLSIFKRLNSREEAKELIRLLEDNDIKCEYSIDNINVDISLANNAHDIYYLLKIKQDDFDKANNLLKQSAASIDSIERNHYIFECSNEELYNILKNKDEWNDTDFNLAKELLLKRGEIITDDLMNSLTKQRIEELSKPEASPKKLILAGYLLGLISFILPIAGLLIVVIGIGFPIVIGFHLFTLKKTLPDGSKIYAYNYITRNHGKRILAIGIISIVSCLIILNYRVI